MAAERSLLVQIALFGTAFGGFGLIASPAIYGNSGIMTFLVNHDGVVYQTDLGPETALRAKAISLFDLDANTVRIAADEEEPLVDDE